MTGPWAEIRAFRGAGDDHGIGSPRFSISVDVEGKTKTRITPVPIIGKEEVI